MELKESIKQASSQVKLPIARELGKCQSLPGDFAKASSLVKVGIGGGGSPNNTDNQGSYKGSGLPGLPGQKSLGQKDLGSLDFRTPLEELGVDVGAGASGGSLPQIKAIWGDFLARIGDDLDGWDWFCTFTFRDPSDPQRPGWTKPGWKYAHTALRKWNDAMLSAGMAGHRMPYWMAMMEYQHMRGVPHWHLLVGGTGVGTANEERRMTWVDWWWQRYGIARILPYQAELGARYYLGKYLVKEMADVVASPQLRSSHRQLCRRA